MENIACHEDQFFILLERVGTKGKYQKNIFLLFFGLWFITAFLILGIAFLFLPNKFVCPALPDQQQCNQYVCTLPAAQWQKFEGPLIINSILTQLSEYHCQFQSNIATYKMILFFGVFLGYLIFMHFSDNLGRRYGMILTWSTAVAGFILISLSRSIFTASIGLFLAGAGCESNMRINLSILNQIVDYHLRQKYSLILQCSFGIAGVFVSIGYYYIRDWRQVNTLFCAIPAFILLFFIVFYLEDTPNHLAKKGSRALLKSLRKIASTNGFQFTIKDQDVLRVMDLKRQHNQQDKHIKFTIRDLFRYKSLKTNTINLAVIFFLLSALYLGPNSAIDQFEIDIFLLQIILSISDVVAYPVACYFISQAKRKNVGLKCFILAGLFNLVAAFISNPEGCLACPSNIIKLIIMFCSRYCVSYYYGVLFIYVVEIYPQQIRTIGFGAVSAIGSLGAVFTQKVMQFGSKNNHNLLLYLSLFAFLCLFFTARLPQTQGLPLQVEIAQLKKQKIKQRYQPSLQQSFQEEQFPNDGSQSHRSSSFSNIDMDRAQLK